MNLLSIAEILVPNSILQMKITVEKYDKQIC